MIKKTELANIKDSSQDIKTASNNKVPLFKRLKKIFLIFPFLFSAILITACGIPEITYDTNVIYNKSVGLNILGTIQSILVNGNPEKSATKYNDYLQKNNPSIFNFQFCNSPEMTKDENLKSITSPTPVKGKYTYYWSEIKGLYVLPKAVDISMISFGGMSKWATEFPAPVSPYDPKKLGSFDYGQLWSQKMDGIYLGVLEVVGANKAAHPPTPIIYIRFVILMDPASTPGAIDILVAPNPFWIEK